MEAPSPHKPGKVGNVHTLRLLVGKSVTLRPPTRPFCIHVICKGRGSDVSIRRYSVLFIREYRNTLAYTVLAVEKSTDTIQLGILKTVRRLYLEKLEHLGPQKFGLSGAKGIARWDVYLRNTINLLLTPSTGPTLRTLWSAE